MIVAVMMRRAQSSENQSVEAVKWEFAFRPVSAARARGTVAAGLNSLLVKL
jgi:hypothetical protein